MKSKKKTTKSRYVTFAERVKEANKTAKFWGYNSKTERATFVNGYFKGFADAILLKAKGVPRV